MGIFPPPGNSEPAIGRKKPTVQQDRSRKTPKGTGMLGCLVRAPSCQAASPPKSLAFIPSHKQRKSSPNSADDSP